DRNHTFHDVEPSFPLTATSSPHRTSSLTNPAFSAPPHTSTLPTQARAPQISGSALLRESLTKICNRIVIAMQTCRNGIPGIVEVSFAAEVLTAISQGGTVSPTQKVTGHGTRDA